MIGMTWEIVVGIIALIGCAISILNFSSSNKKPINELNTSVTKLTSSVDALNENLGRHDRRLDSHSEQLKNHEARIIRIEEHEQHKE